MSGLVLLLRCHSSCPFSMTLDASGGKPGKERFRCLELGRLPTSRCATGSRRRRPLVASAWAGSQATSARTCSGSGMRLRRCGWIERSCEKERSSSRGRTTGGRRGVLVNRRGQDELSRRCDASQSVRLELQSAVFEYIEAFYNRQRRHSTLNLLPVQLRTATTLAAARLRPIARTTTINGKQPQPRVSHETGADPHSRCQLPLPLPLPVIECCGRVVPRT